MRGGPYMPTPILYGPYFYTCSNAGVLTCYEAATGKEVYKERIGGESYTASPVAADGRLYFTSEQGRSPDREGRTGIRIARGEHGRRLCHGHSGHFEWLALRAKPALPVRIGREDGREKVTATAGTV